ncbi:MAG: YlbF family regulator, partial [Anaerobutyricum sp.]|nr:YlbF family regulator [Anaerobutyricum sp.]
SLYLQLEKGQEQYFEKIESLHSEYKDVLTEPVVVDFLSAEQRMCKLMRLVYDGIAEDIKLDLSYMDEL